MASPAPANASQIALVKMTLETASQFVFDPPGVFYRESRISSILKTLTIHKIRNPRNPDNDDAEVMAMATKLYDRWISGDFTPDHPPNVPGAVAANKRETTKSSSLVTRGKGAVKPWEATIKKIYQVFGNNGIAIGEMWSCQEEAWWRGAHGHQTAGISGTQEKGAYSIVVADNAKYKGIDRDQGNRIYYSNSNGFQGKEGGPLGRSECTGRPVRVLRTSSQNSMFAPKCGIRYDGLYVVTDSEIVKRRSDGKNYWLFTLDRVEGQPPIGHNRSNTKEENAKQRV